MTNTLKLNTLKLATEVWQTSHWTSEQLKRLERFAELVSAPLKAENEALRADAERLDHLQRGVTVELIYEGLAPRFRIGGHNSGTNSNLRAAIDTARAKEQTP